jgi:type IV pilus assembly protein PilB
MILVTGPTGSGKTTTLYAALCHVNRENVNIVTVEDPVEMRLSSINQVQMDERAGRSFASALRSILRQDPDVIMVGEIRDGETAEIACRAALTGHLVLSTVHTRHSFGTLARLHDMGVSRYTIAAALNGIIAQRLLRRVCDECAEPHEPPPGMREFLESRFGSLAGVHLRSGRGCTACRGQGTRGRIGVYELLSLDGELRRLLAEGAERSEMRRYADEHGFRTLEEDAFRKSCQGLVAPEEVLRLCAWTGEGEDA